MQIIKFRGKTKSGKLVYGDLIRLPKNINMCHIEPPSKEMNTAICDESNPMRSPVYVIPESVGQFIGIKDKNKKEIYSNDSIKYCDGTIYKISYDDNHCEFNCGNIHDKCLHKDCEDLIEVIEVCDNPEIMGAKNAG